MDRYDKGINFIKEIIINISSKYPDNPIGCHVEINKKITGDSDEDNVCRLIQDSLMGGNEKFILLTPKGRQGGISNVDVVCELIRQYKLGNDLHEVMEEIKKFFDLKIKIFEYYIPFAGHKVSGNLGFDKNIFISPYKNNEKPILEKYFNIRAENEYSTTVQPSSLAYCTIENFQCLFSSEDDANQYFDAHKNIVSDIRSRVLDIVRIYNICVKKAVLVIGEIFSCDSASALNFIKFYPEYYPNFSNQYFLAESLSTIILGDGEKILYKYLDAFDNLNENNKNKFRISIDRVSRSFLDTPIKYLKSPLEDKIIDLVIGLEILLLDSKERRKHKAHYLSLIAADITSRSPTGDDLQPIYEKFKKLYKARSFIVHEVGRVPDYFTEDNFKEIKEKIISLTRHYLLEGSSKLKFEYHEPKDMKKYLGSSNSNSVCIKCNKNLSNINKTEVCLSS